MKLGGGVGSGEVDPGRIMGKSGRENMNKLIEQNSPKIN